MIEVFTIGLIDESLYDKPRVARQINQEATRLMGKGWRKTCKRRAQAQKVCDQVNKALGKDMYEPKVSLAL